jgi:glutathione S-transferase
VLGKELTVPSPDSPTGGRLTLLVCHIDDGGPPPHACKRAQRALRQAGHDFDKVVAARGVVFGLFTTGRRPNLKRLTGQEQLPVLRLPDGTTINGSGAIIAWAADHPPAPISGPGQQPATETPDS